MAFERGHRFIGTEHLLLAILLSTDDSVVDLFRKINVDTKKIITIVDESLDTSGQSTTINDMIATMDSLAQDTIETKHDHDVDLRSDKKKKIKQQNAIEYFTTNLTNKSVEKKIDPVVGRDIEINRVINILCRRTKNNPVLIGEPGVGKTAIVEGLAKRIVNGDVPEILRDKKILSLDLTLMISGTIYRGEFEARLKQVIDELSRDEHCILFIDELHTIIGAGSNQGTLDAANILKPALARGQLHCIGATTYDKYKKYISADPALERRFQPVTVAEPTAIQTMEILTGIKKYYEQFHNVIISPEAIETAVTLSNKYLHDAYQPDKSIDILDEASAAVKVKKFKQTKSKSKLKLKKSKQIPHVEAADIVSTLADRLGVDRTVLESNEWENLERATTLLCQQLIGQTTVVDDVVRVLKERYLGLGRKGKPFASFLFVGPSGVGKTELAKLMAETIYHDSKSLIKLDMSEFAEPHSVAKLLGSPAGYIGYKDRNRLFDELRRRPYSIILFDEIDKAHADVRKLLLQILDEGELTDAGGKKVHFHHAIIILTANIGSEFFKQNEFGFNQSLNANVFEQSVTKKITAAVKEELGAAIVSRLDKICVFSPLGKTDIEKIIAHEISIMSNELHAAKNMRISADPEVLTALATESYHPDLGARPVQRLIERILPELVINVLKQKTSGKRRKALYTLTQEHDKYVLK